MFPERTVAHALLDEAEFLHPGDWVPHVKLVARAAESIAAKLGLDPEKAYVLGLLHDIGRRFGKFNLIHGFHGYQYLTELGFPAAARVCLTHSFITRRIDDTGGHWDGTEQERITAQTLLDSFEWDEYDRLILFCDSITMGDGYHLLEQRLMEVALRRGIFPNAPEKWRLYIQLKDYFSQQLGYPVYQALLEPLIIQ
ncbi:MAG TPA: HDIG domain-containing protein [Bellilinea sp.]|nr:HDIG domain-containing protein [Bellilinea sp.]